LNEVVLRIYRLKLKLQQGHPVPLKLSSEVIYFSERLYMAKTIYQLLIIHYRYISYVKKTIDFQIITPTRATTRVAPTERFVGATLAHALKFFF
jgi:hypothetical protein